MRTIYLFTNTYPSTEQISEYAFLKNEISHLVKIFKLIIVPVNSNEIINSDKLPFEVDYSLSAKLKLNKRISKLYGFLDLLFFKEVISRPQTLFSIFKLNHLLNHLRISRDVINWLKDSNICSGTILYTYWFTAITTGIVRYSSKRNEIITISRAHGIDLYEERTGYLPLQQLTIQLLNKLFVASKAGAEYLLNKFKSVDLSHKIGVSYLGTEVHSFINKRSDDNVIRILSCSSTVEVKRIHLIIESISFFKSKYQIKIYWTHIGGGPLLESYRVIAREKVLNFNFTGNILNEDVFKYYQNNPIDLFISTSASEGGCPVSIQEAMSFGVPVIATSVGGIPELVAPETGVLLDPNPSPKEIAAAVKYLVENNDISQRMRIESKKRWAKYFNADKNFNEFVNEISQLQ